MDVGEQANMPKVTQQPAMNSPVADAETDTSKVEVVTVRCAQLYHYDAARLRRQRCVKPLKLIRLPLVQQSGARECCSGRGG
jgi:hypothetical protein